MAKDRYRYFRVEARELLEALGRGLIALERAPADRAAVATLLRHAHTLKGAARVVAQPGIGDLAHAAEDVLARHRAEDAPPVGREEVDALLALVDQMAAAVAALDAPPASAAAAPAAPAPESAPPASGSADASRAVAPGAARAAAPPAAPAPDAAFASVRVDVRELDALRAAVLEAGVGVTGLRGDLAALDHAEELARALADQLAAPRAAADPGQAARLRPLVDELRRALSVSRRGLASRADAVEREVLGLRSAADRLRLVPVRALFGALERAVRDAARTLDREAAFEAAGGEVRVDAAVLSGLRDALLHVVRNAVAHGLEPAEERAARGKPDVGVVRLEVARRGRRVAFTVRDDGRGVDVAAVRRALAARGVDAAPAPPAADPAALDVTALLLGAAVSTARAVDAVSGRGVGLDVVRDTARRLGAEVAITTEPGRGTSVTLSVPIDLAAVSALHLAAGGATLALPVEALRGALFLGPGDVAATPDGAAVVHGGETLPFAPLAELLRRADAPRERATWSAVLVEADGRRAVLGTDRLLGTAEIVVRPLPAFARADPTVAGTTLDAEGVPRLVLDAAGLVAAARADRAVRPIEPARARAPILVVDDSLTTRMLEQSILESAGYEVELAVSAEEALEKARARSFGLFVVDVEMPGMDGFEFVRVTRADPRLGRVPAILVTSRGAPEDQRRGADAGASAYIVKGEFDQARLLATIRELLG